VAFEPLALPDDYDTLSRGDPITHIERLHSEGRRRWIDPHSHGSYRLGIFTELAMPERLAPCLEQGEVIEQFRIPSGRLHFTGIEYVFQHDDAFLRKHSRQSVRGFQRPIFRQVPLGRRRPWQALALLLTDPSHPVPARKRHAQPPMNRLAS
jgi:hypothetical protein